MAMQNLYNYKKPVNYSRPSREVEKSPVKVVSTNGTKAGNDAYMEHRILSAKPEELTLLLYEGIVRFLKQSKLYIEQKQIEKASNSIIRAQDIVDELNNTLDMEFEVSKGLRSLYTYINEKLVDANIKKDIHIIDEVLPICEELRDAWKEAMKSMRD